MPGSRDVPFEPVEVWVITTDFYTDRKRRMESGTLAYTRSEAWRLFFEREVGCPKSKAWYRRHGYRADRALVHRIGQRGCSI